MEERQPSSGKKLEFSHYSTAKAARAEEMKIVNFSKSQTGERSSPSDIVQEGWAVGEMVL